MPGISNYPRTEIRFKTKNLREWGLPFNRMDALKCMLWHVPSNAKHPHGSPLRDTCTPCRRLTHDIRQLVQKSENVDRLSRLRPDSNYPLKYLSPESQMRRVSRIAKDRRNLAAKLAGCNRFTCEMNDKQHDELLETVRAIHQRDSKVIEEIYSRGDDFGEENNILRTAWEEDVVERLDYEKDQANSGVLHTY